MHGLFRSELPRIVVCASGSGSNFEALVKASLENKLKAKIELLIADKECYAIERAKRLDIPFVKLNKPWYVHFEEVLDNVKPDLIVLSGFMRIIPEDIVKKYFPKIVNIHPSLLPSFPGKEGIKQAYEYGVKVTGITIHFVDSGVDTGPIIFQKAIEVKDEWSFEQFEEEIHKLEHEYYWQVIEKLLYSDYRIENRKVLFNKNY
ncbi:MULTISPECIES: phosphoribosylglycinamide formyltransferase [Fervidobacterium]|uniref:Phosphoribosylglycinamide formyltransferase n=1 Tax=Fervidobacterium nodosum (strain ATCC 35602 / DSM 5306 / Rt17-B1) TaxID=381764 RepID=A7HNM6_FERNB|nr:MULTISPECIES: phosphoribosylglycinamide formyltransferase [Fervidobacterium]ABS61509.1 phosphoribosylglycinamide formyltransferase [Fervidobacterium nodosum Rt17-B1]KAF2961940.1 phosphoribosylglycinamide formyltransferase [Fervidobacterium sp. 2310opik-2]PHJ12965.1 phosphoribosylglycinamide formyltransferase [Fervidobacterium sp. SC_NGM5_G05]HOJ94619.1 phosphoribosylglycinamide formyltransferase [Fervidobacterium nodosum]